MLSGLKHAVQAGMLKDKEWETHSAVQPPEGDIVVVKHRGERVLWIGPGSDFTVQ
jgi:hypothetical protein